MFRRKAAALRARLVSEIQVNAGQPSAFVNLMRREYGISDRDFAEQLRLRARRGDLDWFPRLRFASDSQLSGRATLVVDGMVMISDAYVHADREATREFRRAAARCLRVRSPRGSVFGARAGKSRPPALRSLRIGARWMVSKVCGSAPRGSVRFLTVRNEP